MSALQSELASALGVSTRTVRRWQRALPRISALRFSQYRALRPHVKKTAERLVAAMGGAESLRDHDGRCAMLRALAEGKPVVVRGMSGERFDRVLDVTLAQHSLRREDADDSAPLRERDPERYRLMTAVSLATLITPEARRAGDSPLVGLRLAACELLADGLPITGATLAKKLGIGRATLYRRFAVRDINEAGDIALRISLGVAPSSPKSENAKRRAQ